MPMHTWVIACGLTLAASHARRITWCRLRRASSSPTRDSFQLAPVAWPSSSAPLLTALSVLVPPASIPRYSGMNFYTRRLHIFVRIPPCSMVTLFFVGVLRRALPATRVGLAQDDMTRE